MISEQHKVKYHYAPISSVESPLFLSLFISSNTFIYSISTHQFNQIIELGHIEIDNSRSTFSISNHYSYLIETYLLNQKKFEKVNIAILNSDFTIVPEAYSSTSELKSLLNFSNGNFQDIQTFIHQFFDFKFYFSTNIELLGLLEKTFPNASIRHSGAVLINLMFGQHSLIGSDLFLNILDGFIEIGIKENNKFLFYNVFNFDTNEDILYYLLFTMEQFNLNPLLVKLTVACHFPVTDELINNIKKYIKNLNFCIADKEIHLNEEISKLPQHYYFTLLNQHLCEL